MKKETVLVAVVVLVVGLIIGYMIAQKGAEPARVSTPARAPAPMVSAEKRIEEIKGILAADPANRNAWVALGNQYFDNNQLIESIEAYDKALELQPNDPDVLVDQGVMYRRLGWFDKAIENFSRASELNPKHVNALFNLGVVYRHDLQDFPRATEAWTKLLEMYPGLPSADQLRQEIEWMKLHPAIPKNQ